MLYHFNMKDLHIVIVSWNVQEELERCLKSLPKACEGLNWECVVVDNASSDGTVDMVKRIFANEDKIDLLVNDSNLGFAIANNQGAVQHKSRYILLLNPDTFCPPGSLTELVRKMDLNPKAGIMGPKLLNIDGTYQPSVRRFPRLADQILIILKLHHIFPKLKSLQRYFATDINPNRPLSVEQVMGACFLVRASCWDQMHGLDPRYFIWFEEVDACKTAKKNRWLVWYEPSVTILHYGGQSFSKAFTLLKQRYFNNSLLKYMLKWHGRRAWLIIALLHPLSLLLALIFGLIKKPLGSLMLKQSPYPNNVDQNNHPILNQISCFRNISYWLIGIVLFEITSFLTINSLTARAVIAIFCGIIVSILAYKRPALSISFILLELMLGGFGYLLTVSQVSPETGLSLRMVLMGGFGLGWVLNALRARIWRFWRVSELLIVQVWLFVAMMLAIGLINGIVNKQPYIFQDANAWMFLLYFVPVLDIAHRFKEDLIYCSKNAIFSALIYLPIKALAVLYIFSHGIIFVARPLYNWIRDTRVGEITFAGGNTYRVFFQSAIYSIFSAIFVLAYWMHDNTTGDQMYLKQSLSNKQTRIIRIIKQHVNYLLWIVSLVIIIIGLSRSFWIGMISGGSFILILGILARKKIVWRSIFKAIIGSIFAFILIAGVVYFPFPATKDLSLITMIKNRGSITDAAGSSRWNLLPVMWQKIGESPVLGHGFGSTITYKSQDPRVLANNPDGIYTTYAFEWGWLSFWVKFGIFGPVIMLVLLFSLGWRSWKSNYDWWLRTGVVGSLVALAVIHIFTPYLDHPLGFTILLAIEALLAMSGENEKIATS